VKHARRTRAIIAGMCLALGVVLAACSSPAPKAQSGAPAGHKSRPTTTTSSTTSTTTSTVPLPPPTTTTTTTIPLTSVPNVIGLKVEPARAGIKAAGLKRVAYNAVCDATTVKKQSVAIGLFLPGPFHNVTEGAKPLTPGDRIPKGSTVAIEWSGCYGGGTIVPDVLGLKFDAAKSAITGNGLTWTCQSGGTSTTPDDKNVLSENPPHGTHVDAGTTVAFVMVSCPATSP
jgi:PASTA domain-containing protein